MIPVFCHTSGPCRFASCLFTLYIPGLACTAVRVIRVEQLGNTNRVGWLHILHLPFFLLKNGWQECRRRADLRSLNHCLLLEVTVCTAIWVLAIDRQGFRGQNIKMPLTGQWQQYLTSYIHGKCRPLVSPQKQPYYYLQDCMKARQA